MNIDQELSKDNNSLPVGGGGEFPLKLCEIHIKVTTDISTCLGR